MKEKIKILFLMTIISFVLPNLGGEKFSYRRTKTPGLNTEQLLSLITEVETGTYPLGVSIEDVVDKILSFLKADSLPWEAKERVLSRMPQFFKLLPANLQKYVRREFQKLDRKEYTRKLQQVLKDPATNKILKSLLPSLIRYRVPFSELPSYFPIIPALDRHPYSRYLP